VHRDQGGEYADEEEDEHHVLGKPDVLLMNPGRSSASKEILVCVEIVPPVTPEAPTSARLVQVQHVLLDHPTVDAQLMALPSHWSQTRSQFPCIVSARVILPGHTDLAQPAILVLLASLSHLHWWPFTLAGKIGPQLYKTRFADALSHS
jgi:hypothetical protein